MHQGNLFCRVKVWYAFILTVAALLGTGARAGYAAFGFDTVEPLNTNAPTDIYDDHTPQVATDGAGNWVAVWYSQKSFGGDWDISVARSTDNGATWTDPTPLNTNAATDTGSDMNPQVTADGSGNWVAVWYANGDLAGGGVETDIIVARSTDNGATWTDPVPLNTNALTDSGNDYDPQVTTDGAGHWVAVWRSWEDLGGAGEDMDIFVARSTDNGATWTDPALLNTNAVTDSGNDNYPQVTTNGAGSWVAVWQSYEDLGGAGGDLDIFVARSTDNGATWTAPALLNTNGTTDSQDDDYPQITTDGGGNWVAVWSSYEDIGGTGGDRDILMARSTDNGATWSAPAALNTNAAIDSGWDHYVQVDTDGMGEWLAVWTSGEDLENSGSDWDIFAARSTDDGATWTDPGLLNSNAGSDSSVQDVRPQIATDGAGNWVAVWEHYNNSGGVEGEYDLYVSFSGSLPVSEWELY